MTQQERQEFLAGPVRDGAFYHDPGSLQEADPGAAWVHEVRPRKIFGFGRGGTFGQTRWRF